MVKLSGLSIIGASLGTGGNGELNAFNPATGEMLEPTYSQETEEGLAKAIELANVAFTSYSQARGAKRADFLRAIADGLESEVDVIAERMSQETALPDMRCRGELGRTCGQLRMFAQVTEEGSWVDARIEHADPDRAPIPKPDTRMMLCPVGPVVIFGASNFPLAFSTAGGDTASALAAGCPVVVKAHPAHPGTSELVGKVIQQAVQSCELHEGVFSLVYGDGNEAGKFLVQHPKTKAVGFTGSRAGGRAIMDLTASRKEPIPVYAEMSAINPVFIMPEVLAENPEAWVESYIGSLTLGVGQFCTNPGVLFITEDVAETFNSILADKLAATSPATMLTASICDAYQTGITRWQSQDNVTLIGRGTLADSGQAQPHLFTCSLGTFLNNETLHEEVFGPAGLIVVCPDVDSYISAAQNMEGQLTATIHTNSPADQQLPALVSQLIQLTGRIVYNGFPTGVEVGPAMVHGGPYPATSDGRSTSVGTGAILRFARPVCWQDCPDEILPKELQDDNPLNIEQLINGKRTR